MAARPSSRGEVRCRELNAVAGGLSIAELMERAGAAVAEEARLHLPPPPARVGLLCGLGNNGGDGFVAARALERAGYQPSVWLLGEPSEIHSPDAFQAFEWMGPSIERRKGPPTVSELSGLPLVIDAMLGTGGHGELREPYRSAVSQVIESRVPVLSVDLPTGLGTSTPLPARWTVALDVLKEGMDAAVCGEVSLRSLGLPEVAYERTGPGEFALFPIPSSRARKGDGGRVVVVGGGPYAGAPYLAAQAALAAGADMAFAVVPGGIADVVQKFSPEVIVRGVGSGRAFRTEDLPELRTLLPALRPSALLVGNGAGTEPGTLEGLRGLVTTPSLPCPYVLDADGIRIASDAPGPLPGSRSDRVLLTPNLREATRLRGGGDGGTGAPWDRAMARSLSSRWAATVLVKGPVDLISDGEAVVENRTHHPSLVVGGAGDVLAGVAVSLVARGLSPFQAGRLASYWVGRTSEIVFQAKSYSVLPRDLLEGLGRALREGLQAIEPARRTAEPAPG